MPNGSKLNADDALIVALAAGRTVEEAAAQAAVSARTVYRRLAEPDFAAAVRAARRDMTNRIVGRLADLSTKAVKTLEDLLDAAGESTRLGAARAVLDAALRSRQADELEARVEELECLLSELTANDDAKK